MRAVSVVTRRLPLALACAAFLGALPAVAQLSSPMPGVPGVPAGTGAGVHGANSPFAPLKDRADVLPWSVLTAVKTKNEKNRLLPVFPADIQALHKKPSGCKAS